MSVRPTREPTDATETLYQRIRRDIENNILSGRWPPGQHVPFEHELVAVYSCSRMTVNRVMTDLASAGLIHRKRRVGTIVSQPKAQQALLEIPDLMAETEQRGTAYGYELLSAKQRPAHQEDARRLGVPLRAPIMALKCRHRADGHPFALEDRLLNLAELPQVSARDFVSTPPNTWLVGHIPWTEAEHRISASGADDETATLLEIAPGHACLVLERRTWRQGQSVTAVTMTHPSHLYHLFARFQPAT